MAQFIVCGWLFYEEVNNLLSQERHGNDTLIALKSIGQNAALLIYFAIIFQQGIICPYYEIYI